MLESDSDDNDDKYYLQFCGHETKKAVLLDDNDVSSPALLKAEREQFWNQVKKLKNGLDDCAKEDKTAYVQWCTKSEVATEESMSDSESLEESEEPKIDPIAYMRQEVTKTEQDKQNIQKSHTGENIFIETNAKSDFMAETFIADLLQNYQFNSKHVKDFSWKNLDSFLEFLKLPRFVDIDGYCLADRQAFCTHILFLMILTKNNEICNDCCDIIQGYVIDERCCPSTFDIQCIFSIWGIPVQLLHLGDAEHIIATKCPVVNPTENNVCKMLDYLISLFTNGKQTDCKQAGMILRGIILTALDKRFCHSFLQSKVSLFINLLLDQIVADDWVKEKITELCNTVYFSDFDLHNQLFICTKLITTTPRCIQVGLRLATWLIYHIVESSNTKPNTHLNLNSLHQLLVDSESKIYQLEFQKQYILLKVINSYVGCHKLKEKDEGMMRKFIDWIVDFSAAIPTQLEEDPLTIKTLITQIRFIWKTSRPTVNTTLLRLPEM